MDSVETSLAALRHGLAACEANLLAAQYDPAKLEHLSALALAVQSLEVASTIYELHNLHTRAGIPVLLRSLLECTMRLVFLAKNPSRNALSLELIDNQERLKLLADQSPANPLAKQLMDRNKRLKKAGAKHISFRSMLFESQTEAWNDIYSMFSSFTHGQLSSLAWQSMEAHPKGGKVDYLKPTPDHILIGYYEMAAQLIGFTAQAALSILPQKQA